MRRTYPTLDATLEELRAAGYAPVFAIGKHWKVKCEGLPPIVGSLTPSDCNADKVARRRVRQIIAQNRR